MSKRANVRIWSVAMVLSAMAALLLSCAKDPDPLSSVSVPQIVSTRAEPGVTSAMLEATITSSGNFTGCGFILESPGVESRTVVSSVEGNIMRVTLEGLSPSSQYTYQAFISNGKATVLSRSETFMTGRMAPQVSFSLSEDPYSRSAVLCAEVKVNGDESPLIEFRLGDKDSSPEDMSTVLEPEFSDGKYSVRASSLTPGETYRFVAVAKFSSEEIFSDVREFATFKEASFGDVTASVDGNCVTAEALILNPDLVENCGFLFGKRGEAQADYPCQLKEGSFGMSFTSLEWDKEYYLTAYFETPEGKVNSAASSVVVPPEPVTVIEVSSPEVEAGSDNAVLRSTLSSTEGVIGCGFVVTFPGGRQVEYAGTLSGDSFTARAVSLTPLTEYSCYAFCQTSSGRTVSGSVSFMTLEDTSLKITDLSVKAGITDVSLGAVYTGTGEALGCGFVLGNDSVGMKEYGAALSDGTFSLEVCDLDADTQYRVYAFIDTPEGRITSQTAVFRTKEKSVEGISFLRVEAVPGSDSVSLEAELSSDDGVTEWGFGLSSNGMDYVEYGAQVDGLRMTRTITNLKSGTAYSFYAYVMVGSSRVQSETNTFTTAAQ